MIKCTFDAMKNSLGSFLVSHHWCFHKMTNMSNLKKMSSLVQVKYCRLPTKLLCYVGFTFSLSSYLDDLTPHSIGVFTRWYIFMLIFLIISFAWPYWEIKISFLVYFTSMLIIVNQSFCIRKRWWWWRIRLEIDPMKSSYSHKSSMLEECVSGWSE